jgi:hypothetical protein
MPENPPIPHESGAGANGNTDAPDLGIAKDIERVLERISALPLSEEDQSAFADDELFRQLRRDAFLEARSVRWWKARNEAFGKPACEEPDPSSAPRWNAAWQAVRTILLDRGVQGPIILLAGHTRTGKTLLATGAGLLMIRRKKRVLYNTWFRVGLDFEESMKPESDRSRREILDDLCGPWLLILDEISGGIDSEANVRIFRQLITEREGACKPTILISNHSLTEIERFLPESIMSRIEHSDAVIDFNWSRLD